MSVYQSSLLGGEDKDEINAGFNQVLDIMVDPAVLMCIANSEHKQKARPRWDGSVFVLNCLCYLQVGKQVYYSLLILTVSQSVLSTFDFTIKKQSDIQKTIEDRVTILTNEHVRLNLSYQSVQPSELIPPFRARIS